MMRMMMNKEKITGITGSVPTKKYHSGHKNKQHKGQFGNKKPEHYTFDEMKEFGTKKKNKS